jgi:hypothetical protein
MANFSSGDGPVSSHQPNMAPALASWRSGHGRGLFCGNQKAGPGTVSGFSKLPTSDNLYSLLYNCSYLQTFEMRRPSITHICQSAALCARGKQHCLSLSHVSSKRPGELAKRAASTIALKLQHKVRHTSWS